MKKLDWLKQRQKGIDGNDVGAIMGINNKKSIFQVYSDKTEEIKEVSVEAEAEYWDFKLKNLLTMEFTIRTGKRLRRENKQLVSEEHPFMIANIDRRVVGENAILHCIAENRYVSDEWEKGKIPKNYLLQCQHYMAVAGCDKCYIAVFLDGQKFIIKEIERSEKMIKTMVVYEKVFWRDYVEKKICPPAGMDLFKPVSTRKIENINM